MTKKAEANKKGFSTAFSFSIRWIYFGILVCCFSVLLYTRLYVNHGTTGDEPHYLLMDYSLVHDGDLNLKNNYENKDYEGFFAYDLPPQDGKHTEEKLYSIHGVGLALVLFPGMLLGGPNGVMVELVLIATVLLWLVWIWTEQVTGKRKLAYIASGLLLCCYFFGSLAGYVYPDMLMASLTLGALIILGRYYTQPKFQIIFGLILGLMILVHFKTLALAGPLAIIMVCKLWKEERKFPWWSLLVGLPAVLYFFITLYQWFGVWDPTTIYSSDVSLTSSPIKIVTAMLFDSNRGLLIYNPIMLLLFVGLPIWYKTHRSSLLMALFALLPSMGLLAVFNQWQGGGAPVGRYLIDFLPVFVPAIALVVGQAHTHWQKITVGLLAVLTVFISIFSTLTKVPYIFPAEFKTRSIFFAHIEKITGIAFDKLLPHFSNITTLTDPHDKYKILIGYVVVGIGFWYGFKLSKNVNQATTDKDKQKMPERISINVKTI